MRFWVVTALRYIKSEEITPVELMTANELGSQLTPSARSRDCYQGFRATLRRQQCQTLAGLRRDSCKIPG